MLQAHSVELLKPIATRQKFDHSFGDLSSDHYFETCMDSDNNEVKRDPRLAVKYLSHQNKVEAIETDVKQHCRPRTAVREKHLGIEQSETTLKSPLELYRSTLRPSGYHPMMTRSKSNLQARICHSPTIDQEMHGLTKTDVCVCQGSLRHDLFYESRAPEAYVSNVHVPSTMEVKQHML